MILFLMTCCVALVLIKFHYENHVYHLYSEHHSLECGILFNKKLNNYSYRYYFEELQ
jgi:hypothetical protein